MNWSRRIRRVRRPTVGNHPEALRTGEQSLASRLLGQSAEAEIDTAFDAHKCVPLDSSQNALQVVREATDNK